MSRLSCSVLLCYAWFLLTVALGSLQGQEATGRIIGTVTDPLGAVVAGADVQVRDVATQVVHNTKTDETGSFRVLALPIGNYVVQVRKEGFDNAVTAPQALHINQSVRVDVVLKIGTLTDTVEVAGAAPRVETVNPTLGSSITSAPVIDSPLNGRNVLDLALLQPGVTENDNPGNQNAGSSTFRFSIAGSRDDSITYLLDGGNNNSLLDNGVVLNPNPDAIAEFRVLESNYTAEYGRNGGGIISVVTKSGTNQFHGTAFDFLRNRVFDANRFLNKRETPIVPRQDLKRNQFGGTFGGPIRKDKYFFFIAYQGQREIRDESPTEADPFAAGAVQTVFSTRELNGDFSQSVNGGPDPGVAAFLQSHPFFQPDAGLAAQAIIDPTKINSVTQKFIAAGLVPNSPTGQITVQGSGRRNSDEGTAKFDLNFTDRDHLTATVGGFQERELLPFAQFTPSVNGFPSRTTINNRYLSLAYTKTFSPTLLNVARFTFQRQKQDQGEPGAALPTPAQLGFTGVFPDLATGPPDILFVDTGVGLGFTFQGPAILTNNTFEYSDDLTWSTGRHTWKFGFYLSPYQNNQVFNFIPNGIYEFFGGGSNGQFTGNVNADFLLGLPNFYQQGPKAPSNIRTKSWAGYAQDEWKVTKNLVVTLGLRYEYNAPKYDTGKRTYSIIPGLQSTVFPNAPPGIVFPGDKGAPRGVNFPDRNDFAPRVGFAWDPFGDGKTSIRGGFGVFYDILKAEDNFQFNGTAPFFATGLINAFPSLTTNPSSEPDLFADPFGASGLPNPFPSKPVDHNVDFAAAGFLPWSPISTVDPNLRTPFIYQYNLSLQRELAPSLSFEIDYIGNSGHKLTGLVDINPFILGSNPPNRILDALPGTQPVDSALPTYNIIDEFRNVGNQSYNSLQLALRKDVGATPAGNLYFTLGYTFAHNIDNVSGFRQRNALVPYYNPGQFRANSDIDIRHRITFSAGWDLPFDRLGGPKRLTKGWSLSPILSYRTGFPLDVLDALFSSLTDPGPSGAGDAGLVRANLVGNSVHVLDPHASQNFATLQYLSASNFDTNVTSGYGTLGRNAVPGPSRFNCDLSLSKTTPLWGEKASLQFLAQFFNVFNNTQFRTVNTGITDPRFGQITDTYDPRIGQLALRLRF